MLKGYVDYNDFQLVDRRIRRRGAHAGPGRADEVLDVAPPARSIMIVFALVIRTAEFLFYLCFSRPSIA